MIYAAALVVWSTGAWGLVADESLDKCQQLADAMAKQNNAAREICRPFDIDDYVAMKKLIVKWDAGPEGRMVYFCPPRGKCREISNGR